MHSSVGFHRSHSSAGNFSNVWVKSACDTQSTPHTVIVRVRLVCLAAPMANKSLGVLFFNVREKLVICALIREILKLISC